MLRLHEVCLWSAEPSLPIMNILRRVSGVQHLLSRFHVNLYKFFRFSLLITPIFQPKTIYAMKLYSFYLHVQKKICKVVLLDEHECAGMQK